MNMTTGGIRQLKEFYKHVLCGVFPPIRCSLAYGSAVFSQHQRARGKMLDLIFVVDNAFEWHRENIAKNKDHYSFLHHIGEENISLIQRSGAGVYFNPYVRINSQVMKYGVMELNDFIDDLRTWKWLYISGRLHKPVTFLTSMEDEPSITEALKYNLASAACCSALLMEDDVQFTPLQYFTKLVGLSYTGDFRMYVGEDKMKVHNITKGNLGELYDLYSPVLPKFTDTVQGNMMVKKQGITVSSCQHFIPKTMQHHIADGKTLREAISSTVNKSSIQQTLKGVLTAGVVKSVSYSSEKLWKMLRSMPKSLH